MVVAVGDAVTRFKTGDAVFGTCGVVSLETLAAYYCESGGAGVLKPHIERVVFTKEGAVAMFEQAAGRVHGKLVAITVDE